MTPKSLMIVFEIKRYILFDYQEPCNGPNLFKISEFMLLEMFFKQEFLKSIKYFGYLLIFTDFTIFKDLLIYFP